MQIVHSNTRDQFPLSSKKIIKKTIMSSLVWLILLSIGYVIYSLFFISYPEDTVTSVLFFSNARMVWFVAVWLLGVVLEYFYQSWYYAVYFYEITDDHIVIRKGPIAPVEITIPWARVQDVYVDQDPLDRIMGLYDVHLSSVTTLSSAVAHIDGVAQQAAEGLRAVLLEKVQDKIKAPQ